MKKRRFITLGQGQRVLSGSGDKSRFNQFCNKILPTKACFGTGTQYHYKRADQKVHRCWCDAAKHSDRN